jgi:iron complex transport system ATP-binding protein
MAAYFNVKGLTVGYDGHALIHDIDFSVARGDILPLIGPNGAGKSTILKTVTRHLPRIAGSVEVNGTDISAWSARELAKEIAVVLTDRVRPELVTCAEIVAMGRYPYTNLFGRLTPQDTAAVEEALLRVHALELADRDFSTLSDGQRQRILLARAICQAPQTIVLDEPTAYLDIRYKLELLGILREMAQEKHITVIMSLHEIDLAMKISDYLMCIKGETILAFGRPDDILREHSIAELYELTDGSYNDLCGSVERAAPAGAPQVFVVAGAGSGIPFYRTLQKRGTPFATGILWENDVDCAVARALSRDVVGAPGLHGADRGAVRTLRRRC